MQKRKMMKIAVVDDERLWQAKVKNLLERHPWKENIEIDLFSSGEAFYKKKDYDIVFMDIEMGKMDGFETSYRYKENNQDFVLIFLTTHMEMSRRGYLVNAFRYIDKSNVEEELKEALEAIELLRQKNHVFQFHVVNMGTIHLKLKDILFIETEKRNVIIHTKEQSFVSNRKIEELEEELKEWGFFRSHKSYLVNLTNILKFDKLNIYFKAGKKALVSTRKYADLKESYLRQKYVIANS